MSKIIVNGKEHDILGTKLYYKDICELAGYPSQPGYTVIYRYRNSASSDFVTESDDDGVYLDPESVVIFNVARTNHA